MTKLRGFWEQALLWAVAIPVISALVIALVERKHDREFW